MDPDQTAPWIYSLHSPFLWAATKDSIIRGLHHISYFCSHVYIRLNIFYCISKQRDWIQAITTLDIPFPNITTDSINVTMVDTIMFTANIYNHTYHHSPIPWHRCCWNNIARKACGQACQLFHHQPLWVFNEFDSELFIFQQADIRMSELMKLAHGFLQSFCLSNQQNQGLLHQSLDLFLTSGVSSGHFGAITFSSVFLPAGTFFACW